MNTKAPESALTLEEIDEIRERVKGIVEAENLKWSDVAKEADVKYGTLTGFKGNTYDAPQGWIAERLQIWISSREERVRSRSIVPQVPGYQRTPTAERIMEGLSFAQVMPDIFIAATGSGIGKTTAAEQYQATHPNVWMATMEPACASATAMMNEICEVLELDERSATKLSRAIGTRIGGRNGLLIVDEAQHLSAGGIEQLRTFHDKYGVGLALLGNVSVYKRIGGDQANDTFAQVRSRFGDRITQQKPKPGDVCALIGAWGIADKEEMKLLKAIAGKPGALRGMTKCLQRASMLAAGAGEERTIRHIKAAYERLEAAE